MVSKNKKAFAHRVAPATVTLVKLGHTGVAHTAGQRVNAASGKKEAHARVKDAPEGEGGGGVAGASRGMPPQPLPDRENQGQPPPPPPPPRPPQQNQDRRLLVLLDMNGTLLLRSKKGVGGLVPDFSYAKNKYYIRSGAVAFVKWLAAVPEVRLAFYTSMLTRNAVPAVERLLGHTWQEHVGMYDRDFQKHDPEVNQFIGSPRICAREHRWGASTPPPSALSRGGSLLPSSYADARCIDAITAFEGGGDLGYHAGLGQGLEQ